MPVKFVTTVGELKKFLAEVPDDSLLIRESIGYPGTYANGLNFITLQNRPNAQANTLKIHNKPPFTGDNLLLVGL